jgi:hypothetical protein
MLTYPPSNAGGPADERRVFGNIFWQRVCQKYRHLSRNTNTTEFIFDIAGVRRNVNEEGGLGILGFDEQFTEQRLREIENEGLIELIPERKFRLTQDGIEHCKRLPVTYG